MTGLYTDLYELRMVESYLKRGMTGPATFSLYIRPTPDRPWFVALGVHRVLEFLDRFRFGDEEIAYLRGLGFADDTLNALRSLETSGVVWAVPDGTIVLGDEPILEFDASLVVGQLVETAVINLVQYPTLVATKAARIATAAGDRPVVDFGFRRAHGLETGVEAALAAYVGGGLETSNVEAGRRFGIGVVGTMAHAFVQAFETELEAFRAFAEDHPDNTILLVDTYDTIEGVRNAITVAKETGAVRAIRLDSGDIGGLARSARALLDEAGLQHIRIFASGGLDEMRIASFGDAPIDAFGVGTDLVVSADRPAVDIAYKLVAYDGRGVAKFSPGKASLPGAKQVFRSGDPRDDVLALRDERQDGEPLLRPVWRDGEPRSVFDKEEAREYVRAQLERLPDALKQIPFDGAPPRPRLSDALVTSGRSSARSSRTR